MEHSTFQISSKKNELVPHFDLKHMMMEHSDILQERKKLRH